MSKAVVIVSGGLDSVTLLHKTREEYPDWELHALSFDYGQNHAKELRFAKYQAEQVDATWKLVDMYPLKFLLGAGGSSLVSETEVPEGHYAEDNMKSTVVPNRNMIMLSIAGGYAVAIEASLLAIGTHGGDHFVYPDCRPGFLNEFHRTLLLANEGLIDPNFSLWHPYLLRTKNDIAMDAFRLGVAIDKTWSCYKGGDLHCGRCGTCVERQEAIASTGKADPTTYKDDTFWREALKNHG